MSNLFATSEWQKAFRRRRLGDAVDLCLLHLPMTIQITFNALIVHAGSMNLQRNVIFRFVKPNVTKNVCIHRQQQKSRGRLEAKRCVGACHSSLLLPKCHLNARNKAAWRWLFHHLPLLRNHWQLVVQDAVDTLLQNELDSALSVERNDNNKHRNS
jgi:hypothetical protein